MDRDSTFAQVLGRAPTTEERECLRRLGEAWDIRGNEALLALLFIFSRGATRYQTYGARCSDAVRRTLKRHLATAGRKASQPPGDSWQEVSARTVAEGLVCLAMMSVAGMALATTDFRLHAPTALVPVLSTNCGWVMLVIMLFPASHGALWGWSRARDRASDQLTRIAGWATLTAVILALAAWVVMLSTR
jgi:hypothetical protein